MRNRVRIRLRGESWSYEFMEHCKGYFGTLNGENGWRCARSEEEARVIAGAIRLSVQEGTFKSKEQTRKEKGATNFAKFFDEVYLRYSKENKTSWKHDEFRGKVLKDYFGKGEFPEIKPLLVASFINHRLTTTTKRGTSRNPAVYREVALLSSVFNMAIHENITESNPCRHIPKAARKKIWAWNERKRFLDFDEE